MKLLQVKLGSEASKCSKTQVSKFKTRGQTKYLLKNDNNICRFSLLLRCVMFRRRNNNWNLVISYRQSSHNNIVEHHNKSNHKCLCLNEELKTQRNYIDHDPLLHFSADDKKK
ncbi:hypothetical protein NL108_016840 [Boleophthalmus pectinirostris]|nr:hypothetical protein NL108_016840 [Boleophthalmus pectinirostris]